MDTARGPPLTCALYNEGVFSEEIISYKKH
jgi:hypothetical protein